MIKDCKIGNNVKIPYPDLVNLYECKIGGNTFIGPFVEIQQGVKIGSYCKIESHTFICSGVIIGDNVFIGHGVIFTNDKYPRVNNKDWTLLKTKVENNVSIGSNSTILSVTLGKNCLIGAGSVVTKDVIQYTKVVGNPAKLLKE